ncbi:hypothetical protein P3L10_010455 [Capsicum annuum]
MEEYPSFMSCILRINGERSQKTTDKVLQSIDEVTICRMNKDGMMEISGTVYPKKFLKMLKKSKKKVELCHFQFGECSSNLFLSARPIDYSFSNRFGGPNNVQFSSLIGQKEAQPGYFGGRDGRFLHYGDKPSQMKKSNDSSKEKSHHDQDHSCGHNHNLGRDHDHNLNHNHNHDHVHERDHKHNHIHIYDHDQNHNHNNNHDQNHAHGHDHNHNHVHGHDHNHSHKQLLQLDGGKGKHVEWEKHERKLEHAAGCKNAITRAKSAT